MAKILAIISSPRANGSSTAIVDAITDGAMGLSTNIIDLCRLDALHSAHGCRACMQCKTLGHCVQQDELTPVLDAIAGSDVVIFSTPVYFGGPCAQFKTLQDRMYSFIGPDRKTTLAEGKKAIVVVTAGAPADAVQPVADMIAGIVKSLGFDLVKTVVYSDCNGARPAKSDKAFILSMKELGLRFRNTTHNRRNRQPSRTDPVRRKPSAGPYRLKTRTDGTGTQKIVKMVVPM